MSCLASRSLSSEGRDETAYRIRVPLDVVLSGNPPASTQLDALSGRDGGPLNLSAKVAHQPPHPCPRCRDYDGEFAYITRQKEVEKSGSELRHMIFCPVI